MKMEKGLGAMQNAVLDKKKNIVCSSGRDLDLDKAAVLSSVAGLEPEPRKLLVAGVLGRGRVELSVVHDHDCSWKIPMN
jgi:hypothetical protein